MKTSALSIAQNPIPEQNVLPRPVSSREKLSDLHDKQDDKEDDQILSTSRINEHQPDDDLASSAMVRPRRHQKIHTRRDAVASRAPHKQQRRGRGGRHDGAKSETSLSILVMQLITPNPTIPCTPGMCLEYTRKSYGLSPKYPSAIANWNASTHKHEDQKFPKNIWVPIWFSLDNNPYGHVALRQPDGSIWSASSPTDNTPVHHPSLEDILSYYGGRLTYLGWTEDIEGVLIMKDEQRAVFKRRQR